VPIVVFIEILKKLVAGQIAAVFDNARQSAVIDIGFLTEAVFPLKAQMDPTAVNRDVLIAKRRQSLTRSPLGYR
jgi:hypothetical protein